MEEEISLPYCPTLKSAFFTNASCKKREITVLSLTEIYNPQSELMGAADKTVQNVNINIWLIATITALWICSAETRFNHTESQVTLSYKFSFL